MYQGLEYIHNSELRVHGNLKSSNVVIDARFQCKLTDLQLKHFTSGQSNDESEYSKLKCKGDHKTQMNQN